MRKLSKTNHILSTSSVAVDNHGIKYGYSKSTYLAHCTYPNSSSIYRQPEFYGQELWIFVWHLSSQSRPGWSIITSWPIVNKIINKTGWPSTDLHGIILALHHQDNIINIVLISMGLGLQLGLEPGQWVGLGPGQWVSFGQGNRQG